MINLKLKEILSFATEIYHTDIVAINPGEDVEFYVDQRTVYDEEDKIKVVTPFCFFNGFNYYICPDCQIIHRTEQNYGKIQTGCCLDIDCFRHQHLNGKDYLIKREPIFINNSGLM